MTFGSPFEKGRQKTGGRVKGSRNKLSASFLDALSAEFNEHGQEAIRIVRVERPHEFLKIVASLLPKEFEISDSRLTDISDNDLDVFIEFAKRQLAGNIAGVTDGGKDETLN